MISAEAWWSSSTISARVTPSTADTASWASATIRNEKFGAQKNVGSRRCTDATPSPETVQEATKSRAVIGSSSSGSSTVPSACQTESRRLTPAPP